MESSFHVLNYRDREALENRLDHLDGPSGGGFKFRIVQPGETVDVNVADSELKSESDEDIFLRCRIEYDSEESDAYYRSATTRAMFLYDRTAKQFKRYRDFLSMTASPPSAPAAEKTQKLDPKSLQQSGAKANNSPAQATRRALVTVSSPRIIQEYDEKPRSVITIKNVGNLPATMNLAVAGALLLTSRHFLSEAVDRYDGMADVGLHETTLEPDEAISLTIANWGHDTNWQEKMPSDKQLAIRTIVWYSDRSGSGYQIRTCHIWDDESKEFRFVDYLSQSD
jgi:hypothetical protein